MNVKASILAIVCAAGVIIGQSAVASTVVGVYPGNDGGPADLAGIVAGPLSELARVDWIFDADPSTSGNQLLNPQSDNGLEITGTSFKAFPDDTEVVAGNWSYTGTGSLDYITFKFDGYFAVIDTMGDTSGSFDTDFLCSLNTACAAQGKVFALSHSAGYTVVPVPAALWLFGSGLLGLVGIARRKRMAL